MRIKHVIAIFALGILGASCSDDNGDSDEIVIAEGDYADGILVSNEGPFGTGTGTVSFISNETSTVEASIYNTVNDEDLGNIVQSIAFTDEKAFIIANVSNKITVVDRYTFVKEASIETGLSNPRYMAIVDDKGYVTNWGDTADDTDDYVAIIDLETNTIDGTIPVALGPEAIIVQDNYVFVAHQGAYGTNNKVSVIDTDVQDVVSIITVGDRPGSMQLDDAGDLWVLSAGEPSYSEVETAGELSKINTTTYEVESTFTFTETEHPSKLNLDDDKLYYSLSGGVFEMEIEATALPATAILTDVYPYAMVVNDGNLYTTDANDYASNGSLTVYDIETGVSLETYTVGIIPGGVYFN